MIKVSFIAAFLGGFLTLLPSCGPFMLPAFFAYAFKEREKLIASTLIFFAGFLAAFIPLGLSITYLTRLLFVNQATVNTIAGIFLFILAIFALFGFNIPLIPKTKPTEPQKKDSVSLFIFGVTFGLATSACTAPIFGAIITLAAVAGIGFKSIGLLFTFALGMIFPLFLLAFYFDRIDMSRLRHWFFRPLIWKFPLTNILSAALFIFLGILFITAQASSPFLRLGAKLGILNFFFDASEKILNFSEKIPLWGDGLFILSLALALVLILRKRK